jgi:hypothetical protein
VAVDGCAVRLEVKFRGAIGAAFVLKLYQGK